MKLIYTRRCLSYILGALFIGSALLMGSVLSAQSEPVAPPTSGSGDEDAAMVEEGTFIDHVSVEVVDLEVFVTDRKGNPILDLEASDFEVLEDGRPVSLSHFAAPETPVADGTEAAGTPRPSLDPSQGPLMEFGSAAEAVENPLYIVVYIDNLNIKPFDRNRVFRSLRTFLGRQVDPGRKIMLVTYTRSLKERVPFTSDPSLISRGLLEIEGESALGNQRESERNEAIRAIEESDSVTFARSQARLYASSYHNDTMFTIDAMREMVDSLAGLPGRKAFLYVSGGIPQVPGEDLYFAVQEKYSETSSLMDAREFDAGRRFSELAHLANTNGVTFYTIDAAGLRAPGSASVTRGVVSSSPLLDSHEIHNLQTPLLQLADQTGGQAIINTNDPTEQLQRVQADFDQYYSLAYQPAHAGDGRYHQIEVKVNRKGTRVRHRTGYRSRSLQQRMSDSTRAALLFREYSNQMDLQVSVGEIRATGDRFTVPITVRIPINDLVFLERGEVQEASIEVFFSALDIEGSMSPVQHVRIPITIESDRMAEAADKRFGYEFSLLMRGGDHRIAIGLHDNLGGEESFVIGQLEVMAR
ncbi:MAG: VWA domain-containing protein [Thermoanaerobaculia bacterium]|nr:VWA domain-containing protein [Thermoanaerobaculia bacterium]